MPQGAALGCRQPNAIRAIRAIPNDVYAFLCILMGGIPFSFPNGRFTRFTIGLPTLYYRGRLRYQLITRGTTVMVRDEW